MVKEKLGKIVNTILHLNKNKFVVPILFLLIPIVIILIWFRNGNIMGGGESGIPFYDLRGQYEIAKNSWANPGLGNSVGIGVAAAPTYWFLSRLQNFGVPAVIIQAFFFFVIFSIAGFSVYLLTKEIFPQLDKKLIFLATLFYWFNPISMVNVWNRFLYNYMVFWALLPVAMYLFLRGLKTKDYRFSLFTSLSTVIFSFALSSLVFNILLWFLFIYTSMFFLFTEKDNRFFYLKYLILTFVSYILFNFWWIGQLFSFVFSSGYQIASSAFFGSAGNLSTLTSISQRLGKLTNVLSLLHITFFSEGPAWSRVYLLPLVIFLEFLITGIIFWSIYKYRKIQNVLFLGLLLVITIFFIKGNDPPFGEIFQTVFVHITPLQVFRNPFEKFGFFLPLVLAPLISFSLSNIKSRLLYPLIVFIICIIWGFPFWSGLVFTYTENTSSEATKLVSYEIEVPDYYREANAWLEKQGDNFRFVSLPLAGEGITYTWPKQYSGVESSAVLFSTPNVSFNTTVPLYNEVVGKLDELFFTRSDFSKIASTLNVKYILVREDIDWKARGARDPEVIKKRLKELGYEKNVEFGKLSIYSLPDKDFLPKIWVANSNTIVAPWASFEDFSISRNDIGETIYSASDKIDLPNTEKVLLKPLNVIFLPKSLGYRPEDALASLLYANYLPDDPRYKLVLVKEKFEKASISNPNDVFIFDLTHLGKRAVEVYLLAQKKVESKILKKAVDSYSRNLRKIMGEYPENFVSSPQNQYWGIITEEFYKHFILFEEVQNRSEGESSVLLGEFNNSLRGEIANLGFVPNFSLTKNFNSSGKSFWVFRFGTGEEGSYDLSIYGNGKDWNNFFGSLEKPYRIFLDSKIVEVTPSIHDNFIDLGQISLTKGLHEIAIADPEKINLIHAPDNFIVNSNKKSAAYYNLDSFDPYSTYEISFDYWVRKGNSFNFSVYENNSFAGKKGMLPRFKKTIVRDVYDNDFKNGTYFFSPSSGESSIGISFSADPFILCHQDRLFFMQSCTDEKYIKTYGKETETVIRNVSVKKVFDNKTFLLEDKGIKEISIPKISFSKVNPTEYKVHVTGATSPYTLIFSELYSSGWELRFQNGTKIDKEKHFLADAYANGWLIDKTGSYDLTLKFAPQNLLGIGKKVSLVSSLGTLFLLGGYLWKKRKLSN